MPVRPLAAGRSAPTSRSSRSASPSRPASVAKSARCSTIAETSPAGREQPQALLEPLPGLGRPSLEQQRPAEHPQRPAEIEGEVLVAVAVDGLLSSRSAVSRSPLSTARIPCSQSARAGAVAVPELGEQLLAPVGELLGLRQPALLPEREGQVVQRLGERARSRPSAPPGRTASVQAASPAGMSRCQYATPPRAAAVA